MSLVNDLGLHVVEISCTKELARAAFCDDSTVEGRRIIGLVSLGVWTELPGSSPASCWYGRSLELLRGASRRDFGPIPGFVHLPAG